MGTNLVQRSDGGAAWVDDATASEVHRFGGTGYRAIKVARLPLAGVTATTGGALFSWQNPENTSIIVDRLEIDITTKSSGAATFDFGTAANGTTTSDNLIDGYNANATEKVVNNVTDVGTNGKSVQKMTTSQFITGTGSATTAGLVGYVYIHYYLI